MKNLEDLIEAIDDTKLLELLKENLLLETTFYTKENNRLELMLEELNISPSKLNLQSQTALKKLSSLQEKYYTKDCNIESIMLSQLECSSQNRYKFQMEHAVTVYGKLIKRLSKEIEFYQRELIKANKKINSVQTVADDKLKSLMAKVERYEKELVKLEQKNPWLTDPKYSLKDIVKEGDTLNNLKAEKEKLIKEIDAYKGLKPNIHEASQQLEEIKKLYRSQNPF